MMRNRRSAWGGILLVFVVSVLVAGASTAQASHKDDEIIVCPTPDNCFPQGDTSDDPTGADASGILSYGSGDPSPPPAPPQGANPAPGSPSSGSGSTPQVVTTATTSTSSAATTQPAAPQAPKPPPVCSNLPELTTVPATMDRENGLCVPKCLNHPDYTYLPDRWYKDVQGNCYARGWDNYGMCLGDQYLLVAYPDVTGRLQGGYSMAIYVDGAGDDHHLNCLITDLSTYQLDPKGFVFSGKYVQPGGPPDRLFDSAQPYPQYPAMMPFYQYWVPRSGAAQYVAGQSVTTIQAYGLLWYDGNRYTTANTFVKKYLKRHRQSWRSWKHQNPSFASALTVHQRLLRRR